MVANRVPTFHEERALLAQGLELIAGVDEAGCGAWAGPVYAAAVILPLTSRIGLIRDSKTLSLSQRVRVMEALKKRAMAWAVGVATHQEIDALNIRRAGSLAMRRAVEALAPQPQYVLSDAFQIEGLAMPCKNIIDGDCNVKSVAAASVIAKIERDLKMIELDRAFPGYGFADHKGYGTREHHAALRRLGPCAIHRMSYAPLKTLVQAL